MIINIETTVSNAFHNKHPIDCKVFYEKNQYGMSAAKFDRFVQSKGLSSIDGHTQLCFLSFTTSHLIAQYWHFKC